MTILCLLHFIVGSPNIYREQDAKEINQDKITLYLTTINNNNK